MPSSSKEGPHGALIDIEDNGKDFTAIVDKFKADKGVHFILAFCGGADDDSPIMRHITRDLKAAALPDRLKAKLVDGLKESVDGYIATIVRDVLTRVQEGYRIAVLTGGTRWGVPRIATQIARELHFPTIGVYPSRTKGKDALSPDMLDLSLCVHPFVGDSAWGDESPVLTKMLDSAVVIGGNAGTMVEVAHLLKLNEKKAELLARMRELEAKEELSASDAAKLREIEEDLPRHKLRHIVPIYGTGGTADKLSFFPGKPNTMAACIPSHPITSGALAAAYLIENALPETD